MVENKNEGNTEGSCVHPSILIQGGKRVCGVCHEVLPDKTAPDPAWGYMVNPEFKAKIRDILRANITSCTIDFDGIADKISQVVKDMQEADCENVEFGCPFVRITAPNK